MFSEYEFDIGYLTPSNKIVAPLPGIPRKSNFGSSLEINAADFRGVIGFPQNEKIGSSGAYTTNIGGFETYAKIEESYQYYARTPQNQYLLRAYSRTEYRRYSFASPGLGPWINGVNTPLWNGDFNAVYIVFPSIGRSIVNVPGPSRPNPDNFKTEFISKQGHRYYGGSLTATGTAQDAYGVIGNGLMTDPINSGVLMGYLSQWKNLPRDFRNLGSNLDSMSVNTESNGGLYGWVQGMFAEINADLTDDSIVGGFSGDDTGVTGYDAPYSIELTAITRRNWPQIHDNVRNTNNSGLESIWTDSDSVETLSDEITEKKLRDAYGIFDCDQPDTFEGLGWGSARIAGLLGDNVTAIFDFGNAVRLNPEPVDSVTPEPSQDGIMQLVSADGSAYRVTIAVGYDNFFSGEVRDWVTLDEQEIIVPPYTEVEVQFPRVDARSEISENQENIRALKIEELIEGEYVDVTATKTMWGQPANGVAILGVTKGRSGQLWGFLGFEAQLPQNANKRYRTRKYYRESHARSEEVTP